MAVKISELAYKARRNFGTALAVLAFGGGFAGLLVYGASRPPRNPELYKSHYENSFGIDWNKNFIEDIDNDGDADVIRASGTTNTAYWVAQDMVEKVRKDGRYNLAKYTRVMTPKIQNLATQILQAQNQLRYAQDKEEYRLYTESVAKRKRK